MTPYRTLPRSNAYDLSRIRVWKQNRNANAIFDKKTIKRIETKMEQLKSQMDPSVLKEASEQASALNESVKSFKEHNKRGRPSKPRKRGRPVDTGKEE